jgi:hypothetical protein
MKRTMSVDANALWFGFLKTSHTQRHAAQKWALPAVMPYLFQNKNPLSRLGALGVLAVQLSSSSTPRRAVHLWLGE